MGPKYEITDEMQADFDNIFTFHPPSGDQIQRYERIRAAAKELWEEIATLTPGSAEQTLARRALESMVFWANASIARNEVPPEDI